MIIGYARISTPDQRTHSQIDALKEAGAERIFSDVISGASRVRPKLDAMLEQLRAGDVVIVTKYDRLARSLKDLLEIVECIKKQGADFRSLAEQIDTTSPAGRLAFHVFASMAEFERDRIAERTKEGLEAARRRGRVGGRPPALSTEQREQIAALRAEGTGTAKIARMFNVSASTVRRVNMRSAAGIGSSGGVW